MTRPTKLHVHPAKTQISLDICPVWSDSSMSAWRKLRSLATHSANSENSDHTGRMSLRWAHSHFVGFVMRRRKLATSHGHSTQPSISQDFNTSVDVLLDISVVVAASGTTGVDHYRKQFVHKRTLK